MKPEDCQTIEDVKGLLRNVVCAPRGRHLVTVDWSQIEARGLLWLAGDDEGLDVYRRGEDPYLPPAARAFGVERDDVTPEQRQAGKVAVLASGYGGGVGAIKRMAKKVRVDLASSGVSPSQLVEGWRDANVLVAGRRTGQELVPDDVGDDDECTEAIPLRYGGLWRTLKAAWIQVASGKQTSVGVAGGKARYIGAPGIRAGQRDVVLELPSGRQIRYRNVRQEERPSRFDPGALKMEWVYDSTRGGQVVMWHGILAENLAQAACRDVLAEAMVRLEGAGHQVVLHVHDEVVVETRDPAQIDAIRGICLEQPSWAPGLPLAVTANVGRRWSK